MRLENHEGAENIFGACGVPEAVARQIREICVLGGQSFLVAPPSLDATIYAVEELGEFGLYFGEPDADPDPPSWREYLEDRGVDVDSESSIRQWLMEQYCEEEALPDLPLKLDHPIDGLIYHNWLDWDYELRESPMAQAFHYLGGLELADLEEEDGEILGNLRFVEGDRPGSNLTYVQASGLATLACLQERLNQLGENVGIEIRGA